MSKGVIASDVAGAASAAPVETKQDPAPAREEGTLQPETMNDVGEPGPSTGPTTPTHLRCQRGMVLKQSNNCPRGPRAIIAHHAQRGRKSEDARIHENASSR